MNQKTSGASVTAWAAASWEWSKELSEGSRLGKQVVLRRGS